MSNYNPFAGDELYQRWASWRGVSMRESEYFHKLWESRRFANSNVAKWFSIFAECVTTISIEEQFKMAKFKNIEFVNYELNSKQERDLVALLDAAEYPLFEELNSLATDGYRLSLSYSPNTKSFVASLTAKEDAADNIGSCLTTHGSTPYDAMCGALFKHYHCFGGGEWKANDLISRRVR